jgi:hypothetical protein
MVREDTAIAQQRDASLPPGLNSAASRRRGLQSAGGLALGVASAPDVMRDSDATPRGPLQSYFDKAWVLPNLEKVP